MASIFMQTKLVVGPFSTFHCLAWCSGTRAILSNRCFLPSTRARRGQANLPSQSVSRPHRLHQLQCSCRTVSTISVLERTCHGIHGSRPSSIKSIRKEVSTHTAHHIPKPLEDRSCHCPPLANIHLAERTFQVHEPVRLATVSPSSLHHWMASTSLSQRGYYAAQMEVTTPLLVHFLAYLLAASCSFCA